jgi:hypothetical protein
MAGMHPPSSSLPALEHLGTRACRLVLPLALAEAAPAAAVFVPGASLIALAGVAATRGGVRE